MFYKMKTKLDWSAYDSYGAADAYAQISTQGGAYGKAAAVCIGNRQCQRTEKGVMCSQLPGYQRREAFDTAQGSHAQGRA